MLRQRTAYPGLTVWFFACAIFWLVPFGSGNFVEAIEPTARELQPVAIQRSAATERAIRHRPSPDDEKLLDEIQHGCFLFFWHEVGSPACLVKDRRKADVCSVAAVGFQLASLPIGIERGWISREAGKARALKILRSMWDAKDNRRFGILLHFIDQNSGERSDKSPELQTSTVDHALFAAGAMAASTYFQGDIAKLTDQFVREADWQHHVQGPDRRISFGWRPDDPTNMAGDGELAPWNWKWASDEERIVYFLAAGTPEEQHRVDPSTYYKLERRYMRHKDLPPFIVSWNSSLFTYFFSHCWIDFRRYGLEDPQRFGSPYPPADWFENTRRAALTQRTRCIEASQEFRTLGLNRWGLSPCMAFRKDGSDTYVVPELCPSIANRDNWCLGSVAPYAAASVISMLPEETLAALYEIRHLELPDGEHMWEDPVSGGYGLAESFNLDLGKAQWDHVGIDVGPMLIAIENYRTGLIWKLFHEHPVAKRAVSTLHLQEVLIRGKP